MARSTPPSGGCRSVWLPPPRWIGAPRCRCWPTPASLVTIGRGSTLAIAREAALKLKETCNRHAEAFSGAEFLHGPVALVSSRYPILMFMPTDAAAPGMRQLAGELRRMGTALFVAEQGDAGAMRLADARCRTSPRPMPSA